MSTGYQAGFGGAGGGYNFKPGPTKNQFGSDTATAAQATTERDQYGADNPDWLAQYDADPNLFIELTFLNTMQDATQEVAFIAQRRKGGVWQTVSHNDNTNANLPPTSGAEGKVLQAIGENGETRWGSVIFSIENDSSTDFLTAVQENALAINFKPSRFVDIIENESGFKSLRFKSNLIDESFDNSMQLLNDSFNANFKRITNLAEPVSSGDAISLDKLNQDFDALTHPNVLTNVDKLSDSARSTGYGNDGKIYYYSPNETNNWKVLDINATGHPFMFVHRSTDTNRGFLFIHRSVIEQKIGSAYDSGEIGIVINSGQKGQLGKYNQVAQAGSIWNLQGYSVLDTDDANDAGDDVTYTGDDATYSAGGLRNDGSSLAFLAEYRIVGGITEIQYSSQSEFFALPVKTGGGTFGLIKEFMHFQSNFASAFTLQLFDTVADIAGANIAALSNSVDDQSAIISDLDERVSDLEGDSNVEELTAVRQVADANGLVESILMPKSIRTNFDLLQSQTLTKKLGYNALLTNAIAGRVRVVDLADSSKHHTIYYRIDDGVLNRGDEEFTHDFDIVVSKSIVNDQINVTLSNSNADVNIELLAEVLA